MSIKSRSKWPYFRVESSRFEDELDDVPDDYVKAYLRVIAYMMDTRPPISRADGAWLRTTGFRTVNCWYEFRATLLSLGKLTRHEDGGLSSPWASAEWEYRDEVTRHKSSNAMGANRKRHPPDSVVEERWEHDREGIGRTRLRKTVENQCCPNAAAKHPLPKEGEPEIEFLPPYPPTPEAVSERQELVLRQLRNRTPASASSAVRSSALVNGRPRRR